MTGARLVYLTSLAIFVAVCVGAALWGFRKARRILDLEDQAEVVEDDPYTGTSGYSPALTVDHVHQFTGPVDPSGPMHELTPDCWCHPETLLVDGQLRITHRTRGA